MQKNCFKKTICHDTMVDPRNSTMINKKQISECKKKRNKITVLSKSRGLKERVASLTKPSQVRPNRIGLSRRKRGY